MSVLYLTQQSLRSRRRPRQRMSGPGEAMFHACPSDVSDSNGELRRRWIENVKNETDGGEYETVHAQATKVGSNDDRCVLGNWGHFPRSGRAGHLARHVDAFGCRTISRVPVLDRLLARTADRQQRSCPRSPTGGSILSKKPRRQDPAGCEANGGFEKPRRNVVSRRDPGRREAIEIVLHGPTIARFDDGPQGIGGFFRRLAATTRNHAAKTITRACPLHHLVG